LTVCYRAGRLVQRPPRDREEALSVIEFDAAIFIRSESAHPTPCERRLPASEEQLHPASRWRNLRVAGESQFAPSTLAQALWLQFAEAVCQDKDFRKCEVCGKPFELSPGVARTNRRLCSTNCKVKAHRKRKARVVQLWERGITLPTILRESGSEPERVKKWLAEHMRRPGSAVRFIARELEVPVSRVNTWLRKKGG
jgi:hypothetical protein